MRVIGTAGHVDHGKSTLIAALTGEHPDRLKEEQLREMTIDLGFGWMTLPNGEEIGIVDVPGHRDFIENMLSGIGGIDAALLVIAADEGIMPQTKEHLAILDLLQIPAGLIVLTKTDLASDSAWLDLVENDIRAAVADTVMKDAPIVRVSAKAKTGLDSLVSNLQSLLLEKPTRPDLNRPRLPIDRVFTMSGFGTVVTGTLSDGHLSVGDDVEILPGGLKGRIRGLQTHKKNEDTAVPGSRTAVNISGVGTEQIQRGEVVTHPNQYQPTRRIDARFRLLKDASSFIRHGDEVKFFVGASERVAVLRLLGTEELSPGEEGWIQLELRQPVVAVRGDRYILRRPSPGETLGGGMIVDHQPIGRHKRFDAELLKSLQALSDGSPADILFEAAMGANAGPIKEIIKRSRLEAAQAESALKQLLITNSLITLEEGSPTTTSDTLIIAAPRWNSLLDKVLQFIESYHETYPLRRGIPREELKSRLKLSLRVFNALLKKLVTDHSLTDYSAFLAKPGHKIKFNNGDQVKVQILMRKFEQSPFSPPSVKDCQAEVGEEILNALVELDELITVSPEVIFRKQDYDSMVLMIRDQLIKNGKITLAEVRDLLNTSRKYAQALLEHLDATGITIRDGDFRKLRK
ncbi:MAG: selenocysteine-specific translation elongation factor [Anaerolineae bacterium]|nr:selenocysteine-specific translation elongation factor [Anaerolineae bacterium]MCI0608070.1 selenocysteine-specific translation elongation factor [Anaerolineae bacterium]